MREHNPDILRIYTVYQNPSDFPDKFVIRGWTILPGGLMEADADADLVCSDYADVATEMMGRGLTKLMRDHADDPCILETWL